MQLHLAVETPTGSLLKFTEQSGRKSHNKENETSVCTGLTLSVLIYFPVLYTPLCTICLKSYDMVWTLFSARNKLWLLQYCELVIMPMFWFRLLCTDIAIAIAQ